MTLDDPMFKKATEIMAMSCDEQHYIATRVAANIGYQVIPETDERERFERWAEHDNRAVQPAEGEERTTQNNHYYTDDNDNQAFIGWKAGRGVQS